MSKEQENECNALEETYNQLPAETDNRPQTTEPCPRQVYNTVPAAQPTILYQGQVYAAVPGQQHPGVAYQGQVYNPVPVPQPAGAYQGQVYNTMPCPVANTSYPGGVGAPVQSFRSKSVIEAYLLWFVLGLLGAHHFYLKRPAFGAVYFFTWGLAVCGFLIDLFRMPYLVSEANKRLANPELRKVKDTTDAYTLWFPFGMFGFHHFYLGNPGMGVLYMFTGGVFGVGWIIDAFRMPFLVKQANERKDDRELKHVGSSFMLAVSPLGIFGAQHVYLNRPLVAFLYFFTLGLFGVGWIVDWFRAPVLVKRANKRITEGPDDRKYLDEAYVFWFPLGLLGLHHFYLRQWIWGLLYFWTFGLLGIGWLVDGVRMHWIVKAANTRPADRRRLLHRQPPPPTQPGVVIIATARAHVPQPPVYDNQGFVPQQQPSQVPYAVQPGYPQPTEIQTPSDQPPPYSETCDVTATEGATITVSTRISTQ